MIKKMDAITNTYKQHNEDAYGCGDNVAWVLDGALSLSQTHVTNGPSDIVWMVSWWTEYLNNQLPDQTQPIHQILEQGVNLLNKEFSQFAKIDSLSKLDRASSCIGLLRHHYSNVECYVLGDVSIVLEFKDGTFEIVTDESIIDLDQEVIDMIANTLDRKIVFNGYTEKELEKLRTNRMKMNLENGYAILEHDVSAIRKGIYKTYETTRLKSALIMSDGYSAIYDKYDYCSLKTLFKEIENKGVDGLIPTLREIECDDFIDYKRLRKHDDATAVHIHFE